MPAIKQSTISFRIPSEVDDLITQEAEYYRQPKGQLVRELTEEGLKARLISGIGFRGSPPHREAWVTGTGLDVWQIVDGYASFSSPQEMAERTDLNEAQIRIALAYYERWPEEIDRAIDLNNTPLSELRQKYPEFEVVVAEPEPEQ